jgi:hypothetical protein
MMIESNNHSDIVTWDDQGEVIIIKDKKRFEELILPKFFDSNRYQSFKRQLYNYGFNKKSPDGNNHILFTNPHFHRDKPALLHKIQRNNTNLKKQTENAKQLKNMNGTDIPGGVAGGVGGSIPTAHFSSEVSELKQRVQLLEHENTLLHQTLCAITERLNRMEHIQLETVAPQLSSQQQQQVVAAAAAHVPSYPMPLPVRPSALSASMATSVDPVSSRASQLPPPPPPAGTQAQTAAEASNRILPPLDSQPPAFTSAFSMTNMNTAYCSEENVDENILERDFFSKSNVAEPKRYCDYTTEELKACTDSFRRMIEMMEQKKYSSRVLIVNGDDDDDVHELEERMNSEYDRHCDLLQKSHGNLNSIPLRGQSVTLATSDDELKVEGVGGRGVPVGHDHQLLKSFTQTLSESHDLSGSSQNLNGSSATLPVYNGSNGHYRGGHHEEYDDEDVPADNTTTSSNDDEEDSTNVTLTKLRKCEISV